MLLEWNWWWNCTCVKFYRTCVGTSSLNLQIYFIEFPWEIVFGIYNFRQLFISLSSAVGRCKKECKTSKIIVILGFCRFSIGFRSNKNPTRHVNSELFFCLVNVLVSATFSWNCSRGLHKRGAWPLKTRTLHRNVYIYLSFLNALIIPQV